MSGRSSTARKSTLTLLAQAASDREEQRPKVTRRELEVLELVSEGLSTREIGRRLWVTEETVKTHVRRLHDRLGARTRAQAVAIAFRKGILR
jgi:DNA-binding CsgD family transcriptional regulator